MESFQLHDPYSLFTAPEGAQPCEVYNFSVAAAYVGATYIGDGCSVPSPVYSRMLPSLPNISRLESSLNYSLEKNSSEGVALRVTFVVSCEFLMYLRCSCLSAPPCIVAASQLLSNVSCNWLCTSNTRTNIALKHHAATIKWCSCCQQFVR